jgi:hypothetical protein
MLIRILDIVSYAVLEYPMPQKFSIQGPGYRKLAYMTGRFILISKVSMVISMPVKWILS